MIIATAAAVVKFSEPIARQPDSESDCSTALRLAAPFNHQSVSESTQAAGWSTVSLSPGLALASLISPGPVRTTVTVNLRLSAVLRRHGLRRGPGRCGDQPLFISYVSRTHTHTHTRTRTHTSLH